MGGSKGTVSVRLATLADQSPASVKPLLEAVRGSMAGATKGSGTRKELLDGADLSYLAERAQAVVTNPALQNGSEASIIGILPALVATLSP
jgi:hypothetical protein